MKDFKEISKKCPFRYTGRAYKTFVCIAKKGIPDRPFDEVECSSKNCAIHYFLKAMELDKSE